VMVMKACTKCSIEKPLSEFHNCASKPDGKFSACKHCRNSYNKAKSAEIGHDVLYRRAIESAGEEAYKDRTRQYYEKNKESIKARSRQWSSDNKERKALNGRIEYQRNRARYLERASKWSKENRDKRSSICLAYFKRMKEERPHEYVTTTRARKMIHRILAKTGKAKLARTFELLGYSREQFEARISALFEPGMEWGNHGEWHIDHIIPVAELVRCGVTDPAKINALSNLRPLWAADNMAKRDSFELAPPDAAEVTRATKCHRMKSQTTALTC